MRPLAAALSGVTHLLILPTKNLDMVPFSALIDEFGHYVGETKTITLLFSARLSGSIARTSGQRNIVVLADPTYDLDGPSIFTSLRETFVVRSWTDFSSLRYTRLSGTLEEAKAIKDIYPHADLLLDRSATEAALKAVHHPNVLHLATHGYWLGTLKNSGSRADPDDVEEQLTGLLSGGLVLAGVLQGRSGEGEDGILTGLEAAGLDLQGTELVTLSACNTGMGNSDEVDGSKGLVEAFLGAGAENVISTGWSIDDRSTSLFMKYFYSQLATLGTSPSVALARAMRQMIKEDNTADPYYWAGFQLWASGVPQ
jgi:CHAT domain-containing protein